MEIVWLWLDDLDDLVFCCARLWGPLRCLCLQVGLAAALMLEAAELASVAAWSNTLAAIAAASVALWTSGAVCAAAARLKGGPPLAAA